MKRRCSAPPTLSPNDSECPTGPQTAICVRSPRTGSGNLRLRSSVWIFSSFEVALFGFEKTWNLNTGMYLNIIKTMLITNQHMPL